MKLFNKISNAKWFASNNRGIKYNTLNRVYDENGYELFESNNSLQEIIFEEPYFYINDIEGNSYLIGTEYQYYSGSFIKKVINDKNLLVTSDGQTQIFDIDKKLFVKLFDFKIFKFQLINNSIVIVKKGIQSYSLLTAQPLWHFDLNDLGEFTSETGNKFNYEVEKFLGVIDDVLLVLLKQKEILVLDINSGQIKQRLQRINNFHGQTSIDTVANNDLPFFITNYHFQENNKNVIALFEDVLYEIKIDDNQLVTNAFGLKEEFEKSNIKPGQLSNNTFLQENKIYFLEQELGRFGILNVKTKKIEYVSEKIEMNGHGVGFDKLKEIQATSDKLYVLDKTNTIHIFKKV